MIIHYCNSIGIRKIDIQEIGILLINWVYYKILIQQEMN